YYALAQLCLEELGSMIETLRLDQVVRRRDDQAWIRSPFVEGLLPDLPRLGVPLGHPGLCQQLLLLDLFLLLLLHVARCLGVVLLVEPGDRVALVVIQATLTAGRQGPWSSQQGRRVGVDARRSLDHQGERRWIVAQIVAQRIAIGFVGRIVFIGVA